MTGQVESFLQTDTGCCR